jgi:hypothetical protein
MKFLAILPLVLLLVWLWLVSRSIARLRGELDQAESRLARRFYTLQGRVSEIDATVRELDFERRRALGEIRFDPSMTIGEAVAVHPKVGEILVAFGLGGGGCAGGGLAETISIADACSGASLDVQAVLNALRRFADNPDAPLAAHAATAKLHQIERRFEGA